MAEKKPPSDPAPDLFEIERTSREFHDLASKVSDQLKAFEDWFSALPGKVDVSFWDDGNETEPPLGLRVLRHKDGWQLNLATPAPEGKVAVRPVESASLAEKCRAIAMLPGLLQTLYREQRLAVERLKRAAKVFAQLADPKGGK